MIRPLTLLIAFAALFAAAPAGACAADDGCLTDPDLIRIEGRVFADFNNNGTIEADEDRSAVWRVYADLDFDGDRDPSEPWTQAELTGKGEYVLELNPAELPEGGGKVPITLENLPESAICTAPESCTYYETPAAGDRIVGRDFGVGGGGQIRGYVWDDLDADGVHEEGEPPLAGARVWIDADRDGEVDSGEPTSGRTALGGQYLMNLGPEWVGKKLPPIRWESRRGQACTGTTACPYTDITLEGIDGRGRRLDFTVNRPLIVFIHGYGGAEISCGNDILWIRASSGFPEFDEMRFERDGSGPLKRSSGGTACTETAGPNGNLVTDVGGSDIYGGAAEHYKSLVEDGRYVSYVWDFRRSPKDAVQGLDELVNRLRCGGAPTCATVKSERVVLVGHSQGGLVAKQYLAAGYRARKVARFVAIGSPFWGSPKAIFPLYAGVETALFSELDPIFDNDDLKAMARTLPGHHSLLPAHGYGPFLTVPKLRSDGPLDVDGVEEFLRRIGSNPALYTDQAVEHINVYDHFEDHGVDFQLVVGEGLPTIGRVRIETGVEPWVESHLVSGDATVPAFASAHDAPADRIHYVCGVSHIPLTADPQTTALIDKWLVTGEKIQDPPRDCPLEGVRIHLYSPSTPSVLASASASAGGLSLAAAEKRGLIDVVSYGKQTTITARRLDVPLDLGSLRGATVAVAPLRDGRTGREQRFGPLSGRVSIAGSPTGAVVRAGGRVAKPARADTKAPRTRALVRGGRLVLKVRDASKVAASYVILGSKRRRWTKPLRLSRRDLAREKVASVDVWGNAEVVHR